MSNPKDKDVNPKQNKIATQSKEKESEKESEKENVYPVHQYTKLLGKGTWQSREPELIPTEGDELKIPKHHEIPKV